MLPGLGAGQQASECSAHYGTYVLSHCCFLKTVSPCSPELTILLPQPLNAEMTSVTCHAFLWHVAQWLSLLWGSPSRYPSLTQLGGLQQLVQHVEEGQLHQAHFRLKGLGGQASQSIQVLPVQHGVVHGGP